MQNKAAHSGLLLFGEERRAWPSSALLSSGVRAGRDRSPLGRTWGVSALWSDNSPQPEGGSPNWNVFWQRHSRCFQQIEPPSGNRENWDVGEKVRWSETGWCSNTGSNKLNSTDESRRLSAVTMRPWRKASLEYWSLAQNTNCCVKQDTSQTYKQVIRSRCGQLAQGLVCCSALTAFSHQMWWFLGALMKPWVWTHNFTNSI